MKKIAVVGCNGRMGSLITNELKNHYEVVGIGRENSLEDVKDVSLVVDFATHESSVVSAEYCLKKGIPLVIGSTGQTEDENKRLDEISKKIIIIKKANFSAGIEVLKSFIENVLKLHPKKFEIVEKHHKYKKDKPSGTAKELELFIRQRFFGDVEVSSIREGEEMGEHKIVAYFCDEKITIKHNVYSREAFVRGVIETIKNLLNK